MAQAYRAPMHIECPRNCEVPKGTTYYPIDRPAKQFEDVKTCPFEDCQQSFLVNRDDSER